MTTQINVIVDNGGLSEKAKRQTQANRWAKLEGANRQKVEAKGIQQRDAERLIRGIGPDGRPLYGTQPAQPLLREEPAAYRNPEQDIKLIITPLTEILGTTSDPNYYYEVARRLSAYARRWNMPTDGTQIPRYIIGSGRPNPYFYLFGEGVYTFLGPDKSGYQVEQVAQAPGLASLSGVLHFNLVDDSLGLFCRHKQLIFKSSDSVKFTMEFWIYPSSTDLRRTFALWLIKDAEPGSTLTSTEREEAERPGGPNTLLYLQHAELLGVTKAQLKLVKSGALANSSTTAGASIEKTQALDKLEPAWTHVALVASNTGYTCFINGVSVLQQERTDLAGATIGQCVAGIDFYTDVTADEPYEKIPVYLSQFRFSRKVKYTANFTPPTML